MLFYTVTRNTEYKLTPEIRQKSVLPICYGISNLKSYKYTKIIGEIMPVFDSNSKADAGANIINLNLSY